MIKLFRRYTMDEIMSMMVENDEGEMEFPRNVMLQDCFSDTQEPLYGFVTNVTLVNNSPCILGVECFENGTKIDDNDLTQRNQIDIHEHKLDSRRLKIHEGQEGILSMIFNKILP